MFTQKRTFRARRSTRLLSWLHWILLVVLAYCIFSAWLEANTIAERFQVEKKRLQAENEVNLGELDSHGNWKD